MEIYNSTRNTRLAENVIMADNFFLRLRGLLGKKKLPRGWCMALKPCNSVHTMFMAFDLDLLFIDKKNRVVELKTNMPPYRFSKIIQDSHMVLEFPAGSLEQTGTTIGDKLIFTDKKNYAGVSS